MPPEADADRVAVAFARVLRGAGLDVPVGSTIAFGEALAAVGLDRRDGVYWAGHATLLRGPEDRETYDRAFGVFWDGKVGIDGSTAEPTPLTLAFDADQDDADHNAEPDDDAAVTLEVRWSRAEVLRHHDFAAYTHAELVEARRMMADLRLAGALRRSRRRRPTRRERGRPDLRRTVRRSLRSAGEPIDRAFSSPSRRPRRVVLLCDVSGSMEPYARAFLRFVQAAVVGRGRVEAFAIGTRLTRITRELSSRDPDAALTAAAQRVVDFSGGTRLGEGLRAFNDQWGVRGMARGAVIVILSDGWDRGDPSVLGEEMARLGRVAHRIVWVNPLKATPEYAPLARGMAAALPHVDEFVTGHSLAALEELAEVIGK
ncbi:MAG: VWA domain-containing protein [Acidimicrobiia bacterium]